MPILLVYTHTKKVHTTIIYHRILNTPKLNFKKSCWIENDSYSKFGKLPILYFKTRFCSNKHSEKEDEVENTNEQLFWSSSNSNYYAMIIILLFSLLCMRAKKKNILSRTFWKYKKRKTNFYVHCTLYKEFGYFK